MEIGERFTTHVLKLDKSDLVDFASVWDPQPFHLSEEGGRESPFGGLIGSGLQSICALVRLGIESGYMSKNCIAGLGIDVLKFRAPLIPGASVRATFEVVSTRRSRSRQSQKIVSLQSQLFDDKEQILLECVITNLYLASD